LRWTSLAGQTYPQPPQVTQRLFDGAGGLEDASIVDGGSGGKGGLRLQLGSDDVMPPSHRGLLSSPRPGPGPTMADADAGTDPELGACPYGALPLGPYGHGHGHGHGPGEGPAGRDPKRVVYTMEMSIVSYGTRRDGMEWDMAGRDMT
jgi:hypothetical protein